MTIHHISLFAFSKQRLGEHFRSFFNSFNFLMFPISALTISNIHPGFTGNWECRIRTSRGNTTRTVHIVVLESSAKYCAPERVSNNKGEFRFVEDHNQKWRFSFVKACILYKNVYLHLTHSSLYNSRALPTEILQIVVCFVL